MTDEQGLKNQDQSMEEAKPFNEQQPKKYELTWPAFILFILLFIGLGFAAGIIINLINIFVPFVNLMELVTTGYYALILDGILFFVALFLYTSVRKFTLKAVDFTTLRLKSTYGYLLAGFIIISVTQYVMIGIIQVDDPSAQYAEIGFAQITSGLEYFLLFLSIVIITPIKEELIYRGIMHRFLESRHHFWVGFIVSSLTFGLAHYTGGIIVSATVMGMIFVLLYRFTNSLVPGMILHILWNSLAFLSFVLGS